MRVILIEEGNFESGLLGFINCLQKEPDLKAPNSLKLTLYFGPLETDLVTNVNSLKNTIKSIVRQDQHILDKFKDQNDFMLVEYSFGLLIAIELTRKLETKRFIGQLILEELEINILFGIINTCMAINSAEVHLYFPKRLQAIMPYDPKPIPYVRITVTMFKPLLSSIYLLQITKAKVGVVDSDHVTILYVIDTKIVMAINDELF
ncbi:hypothetical protein HZH66_003606 [Vespula vulgaris]|uniref:Uncharacterized protein n=1 Tax=Vespula vulgaris TaxID=7454 RepID=A0A834NC83_VESVU|nr:hypothetical protein HZH66_003606 [Vespula vulgaris]